MITLALVAFVVCAAGALFIYARKSGAQAVENEVMKETLDDVHTAKLARDRLAGDSAMRHKLRHRNAKK